MIPLKPGEFVPDPIWRANAQADRRVENALQCIEKSLNPPLTYREMHAFECLLNRDETMDRAGRK